MSDAAEPNPAADDQPQDYSLALPGDDDRDRTFGTLGDKKRLDESITEGSSTDAKDLEKRRRAYESLSVRVDAIRTAVLTANRESMTAEQMQKLMMHQLVLSLSAMVQGLGLVFDCLSYREERPLKGGRKGYARVTAAAFLDSIEEKTDMMYGDPDENGDVKDEDQGILDIIGYGTLKRLEEMAQQQQLVLEALHRIGLHFDPKLFAGEYEDPKSGTKLPIADILDFKTLEKILPKQERFAAKPKKTEYADSEAMSEEEIKAEQDRVARQVEEDRKLGE
jgi:hypothetical protein